MKRVYIGEDTLREIREVIQCAALFHQSQDTMSAASELAEDVSLSKLTLALMASKSRIDLVLGLDTMPAHEKVTHISSRRTTK